LYINERLGAGAAEAGTLSGMFELGGPLSMMLGGYLSDKLFQARRMPVTALALLGLALLVFAFPSLPATRLAIGLGFFGIGFLLYLPDSLISATAAVDFGTRRGASTAAGVINGCGSVGQLLGSTMPGWIGRFLGEGADIWGPTFHLLALGLFVGALLLLPQWNRLPTLAHGQAPKGSAER
jgi:OPA family sugar phosphate sensor protein UhpC-like MFS transporter